MAEVTFHNLNYKLSEREVEVYYRTIQYGGEKDDDSPIEHKVYEVSDFIQSHITEMMYEMMSEKDEEYLQEEYENDKDIPF